MTDEQRIRDFLEFLQEHPNSIIITEKYTYTYSALRDSIIKTLQMAHMDGGNPNA